MVGRHQMFGVERGLAGLTPILTAIFHNASIFPTLAI